VSDLLDDAQTTPLLSTDSAAVLNSLSADARSTVADELRHLTRYEVTEVAARISIPGLTDEYSALILPSGHQVVYRVLSAEESKEYAPGAPGEAVLIVDLRPPEAKRGFSFRIGGRESGASV
jgi:hypothetical protein